MSDTNKIRISFDLDEVLFVNPKTHKTEPRPPIPFNILFRERLRLGTIELIRRLKKEGFEVWVYTSSFRSTHYIRSLFALYRIRFDGIVNGDRHLKEVQGNRKEVLPQKMPGKYRISLHIDDEPIYLKHARSYGFNMLLLDEEDDSWVENIMQKVYEIERRESR